MATMHHCSLRSCLLVERALVRLLNTVCAILSTQFKHELVQNNSTTSSYPLHHEYYSDNKNNDALLLFRRMCMGVVDLNQIDTSLTSDLQHTTSTTTTTTDNNNNNNDSNNFNWERCNSTTSAGLISSLKVMDSIDWAMCFESSKFDIDNEFHRINNNNNNNNNNVFQSDFDESPLYDTNNNNNNNKLATIDSICDLLAPYIFRDGDLGWQARDSLLLIAAYSLRDEEFSYSIAKYSSICAVIATGLGILYTALPYRLVNNNSPETWPILIRTLNTNQLASAHFNEFLNALDFCRSLLEIAHPLIQSCLLHCIHTIFFVSIIGPALTQKAPEDVITATVYLEQFIIHTVGSSLLPILLRFLLMKLPSTTIVDADAHINQTTTTSTTINKEINPTGSCQASPTDETFSKDDDDNNSSVFSPESNNNNNNNPSLFDDNQFITSNSITYMDLIIARIHQCNSLLGITTMSLMNTIIDLHCEDVMFVLVLKYLISVRDNLLNIGWTWPDPGSVTDASTKLLNLSSTSSMKFNLDSTRFDTTTSETTDHHHHHSKSYQHYHEQHQQQQESHRRSNTVAQLDIDNVEELNYSSDQSNSKELHNNNEGLEVLELSSNHSSPTSPPSITSMSNNESTTINSPNSMLDWLSYTSWAHQTIKIRKHACKTWQLTFDANQPTREQINLLNENLKNLQMTEKEFITRFQKTQKFSECDFRISLDPYKIYTEYKCFINKNCSTNLDVEMNANELHAKALCSAAKKLNIDTDLDLDGSENLDDCPPIVESNDPCEDQSQQKQHTSHEKLSSNQQIHKSNVSVRNSACMSSSSDYNLCTSLKKPNESFENSTEALIHTKLCDKSLIKSWYCLNFPDSLDINEQLNINNTFNDTTNTTKIAESSKLPSEEMYLESLVSQSECTEQNLQNNCKEYVTVSLDSDNNNNNSTNCLYSEEKSCEINKFIEELENFSSENLLTNFTVLDKTQEQVITDKMYFKNTTNINRCNSLSCLNDHTNDTCHYVDKLFNRFKVPSLQTLLPNQCNNHDQELFETCKSCKSQLITSISFMEKISDVEFNKSFDQTTQRVECLTDNQFHNYCHHHHHEHHDNYYEMNFNHGSLNNLIQNHFINDITNTHDHSNSLCSLMLIPPMNNNNDQEKIQQINCKKHHFSLSKIEVNDSYKNLNSSTIPLTTTTSLEYNDMKLNIDNNNNNNTRTSTVDDNTAGNNSTDSPITYPNLGPFLTTLLNRLENFTNNCFYANLYLTNLISSLASYPIPLLRAILFLTNNTTPSFNQSMKESVSNAQIIQAINDDILYYLPYNILCLIKEQIELFNVLYTKQIKYFGLYNTTMHNYSFDELKQEARRYLNGETVDLSKLSMSMNISSSTKSLEVDNRKKNITHKESKNFTTNKQTISPMMNSNRRSYFRKWFSLSSKSNNNKKKNQNINNNSGNNLKNTKNTAKNRRKSSNTNVLNPKDLLDFSQILQKPMIESTFLIDLDSNYQQLINMLSDKNTTTISGSNDSNGSNIQQRRRIFRLSTIKRLKTNVNTDDRIMSMMMMMNTENSILDVSRIQRMVLCAVIFEDFCKELAAICTEHSIQW
ncbi:unnamed protein product [Schistosoma turkestanicum]|nr:unnamed protein product [Schistosoma turkestanicum]